MRLPQSRPISLWSGPRNVSTALMYSFAQHPDIRVVDEPLYAHFLQQSGRDDPGREDILRHMQTDGQAVLQALCAPSSERLFLKQMAHHLVAIEDSWLQRMDNILLIRNPRDMLPSLTIQIPNATPSDTGLERQWEIFDYLRDCGQTTLIIDAQELLADPRSILGRVCSHLNLEFRDAMLHWAAGPRPEDGVWAEHWYHAVHRSSGFHAYTPKTDFPAELNELLNATQPWYERLYAEALKATD